MGLAVISCGLIWELEQMDTYEITAWMFWCIHLYKHAEKYRTHTQTEEHKFNGFRDMGGYEMQRVPKTIVEIPQLMRYLHGSKPPLTGAFSFSCFASLIQRGMDNATFESALYAGDLGWGTSICVNE